MTPRVTVIIPTFDWATVLPWSIGSVLEQSMADFELLVIGDGCTDGSEAIVSVMGDHRVQWHNLPHNGRSQAGPNNLGLSLARAPYVAHLGHDDLWLPSHLEVLCRVLDDGAGFAWGDQIRSDPGRAPYRWPPEWWNFPPEGDWIPPTAVMYRRDAALAAGGWRFPADCGRHDPETDLWARLAARVGPPSGTGTITSVKMPAVLRRDSYRSRSWDEQARWWSAITECASGEDLLASAIDDRSLWAPDRFDASTIPGEFTGTVPASAVERHSLSRREKGLDD